MFWTDAWKLGSSLWANGLALQETALASAGVIQHRSGVIDAAMRNPLDADATELSRMVTEKVVAFTQAGQAVATGWFALQADLLAQGQDMMRVAAGGTTARAAAGRIGKRATRIALKTSKAGGRALKPVHATATANKRRLGAGKTVRR